MSLSAVIPAANMQAANDALEAQGFGPGNFSVLAYAGVRATHAALHAWNYPAFEAAVSALPDVTISNIAGSPFDRVQAALPPDAGWSGNISPLEGEVTPGLHLDGDGQLWQVIQPYNTATWPDPRIIPALIRRVRAPGEVTQWVQPIDQFDAYLLVDPFTGEPERVTHQSSYYTTLVDINVWEPGTDTTLWQETGPDGSTIVAPPGDTWNDSGATFEGVVGGGVIWVSDTSLFQTPEPIRIGTVEITANSIWSAGTPGILAVSATPVELQFGNTANGTAIEVFR